MMGRMNITDAPVLGVPDIRPAVRHDEALALTNVAPEELKK